MRRQCARPGCSAVATTTFTFDSREQTVWLDAPREGQARAGELCSRHARSLAAPRGWRIIDRREGATTATGSASTSSSGGGASIPPPARRAAVVAPITPAPVAAAPVAAAAVGAPAWYPRFERGDTLGGVLEASTPLLARAFGNVRAG